MQNTELKAGKKSNKTSILFQVFCTMVTERKKSKMLILNVNFCKEF